MHLDERGVLFMWQITHMLVLPGCCKHILDTADVEHLVKWGRFRMNETRLEQDIVKRVPAPKSARPESGSKIQHEAMVLCVATCPIGYFMGELCDRRLRDGMV